MGIIDPLYVLPGFSLAQDEDGHYMPAENDQNGILLNGSHRFDAARIMAEKGAVFFCAGPTVETVFMTTNLPGIGHWSLADSDRFATNTGGNIEQIQYAMKTHGRPPEKVVVVSNFYHGDRWMEHIPGIHFLPAEVILTAKHSWGLAELRHIYGNGAIADTFIAMTREGASRLRAGGNGWLKEQVSDQYKDIVSRLPVHAGVGPISTDLIDEDVVKMFRGRYLKRVLREWCGLVDHRGDAYASVCDRPTGKPAHT